MTQGHEDQYPLSRLRLVAISLPLALLVVMGGRLVRDATADSLTVDEPVYIQNGVCAVTHRVIDVHSGNPPIFQLLGGAGAMTFAKPATVHCSAGLPKTTSDWATRSVFATSPTALRDLTVAARLPIIALALLLAVIIFLWAKALYGYLGGIVAMAIVTLEPTLLGHAHLVTGDLSLTFGLVVSLAAHWRWTQTRHGRWLLIAGAGLGWALLSKASALAIVPVLLILEFAFASGRPLSRFRQSIGPFLTLAGTAWAVVCLTYLPFISPTAGRDRWPPLLSWFAPSGWFANLSFQFNHIQVGHVAYLNGHVATHGFLTYFLEATALKTTLGLLLLGVAAGVLTVVARHRASFFYLWLPMAAILIAASVARIDIGVRYVLPLYPLLAIAAGLVVASIGSALTLRRSAVGIALLAVAVSSLAGTRNDIAYFNELAGSNPAAYLSDSNLDWGQDAWQLKTWWEKAGRPPLATDYFGRLPLGMYGVSSTDVQLNPPAPARYLGVSVQMMTTSSETPGWPRENQLAPLYHRLLNAEPDVRIGASIRIYRGGEY